MYVLSLCLEEISLYSYVKSTAASPYVRNLARELYSLLVSFREAPPALHRGVLEALLLLLNTTPKPVFSSEFTQSQVQGLVEWMMDWAGGTQDETERRLLGSVLQAIQNQISSSSSEA
jgi:hypothetical protein